MIYPSDMEEADSESTCMVDASDNLCAHPIWSQTSVEESNVGSVECERLSEGTFTVPLEDEHPTAESKIMSLLSPLSLLLIHR